MELNGLYRVVYISHSVITDEKLTDELIDIEKKASTYNKHRAISGCLIYCNHMFIQTLEGAKTDVLSLVDIIQHDKRHSGLTLIFSEYIQGRNYNNWSQMKVIFDETLLSKLSQSLEEVASLPLNTLSPEKVQEIMLYVSRFQDS